MNTNKREIFIDQQHQFETGDRARVWRRASRGEGERLVYKQKSFAYADRIPLDAYACIHLGSACVRSCWRILSRRQLSRTLIHYRKTYIVIFHFVQKKCPFFHGGNWVDINIYSVKVRKHWFLLHCTSEPAWATKRHKKYDTEWPWNLSFVL